MKQFFSTQKLEQEITQLAQSIGLAPGFTETISNQVASATKRQIANRQVITQGDLERIVARELRKYSLDLSYIYHNRDKII